MPRSETNVLQHSDLNAFLFADVGVEANGMTLTVLSMLARTGEDPWQEAEYLALMPRVVASGRLTQTLAAMPNCSWAMPDVASTARRLVDLLPTRSFAVPLATGQHGKYFSGIRKLIAILRKKALLVGLKFDKAT